MILAIFLTSSFWVIVGLVVYQFINTENTKVVYKDRIQYVQKEPTFEDLGETDYRKVLERPYYSYDEYEDEVEETKLRGLVKVDSEILGLLDFNSEYLVEAALKALYYISIRDEEYRFFRKELVGRLEYNNPLEFYLKYSKEEFKSKVKERFQEEISEIFVKLSTLNSDKDKVIEERLNHLENKYIEQVNKKV